jgi:hypothetical protein
MSIGSANAGSGAGEQGDDDGDSRKIAQLSGGPALSDEVELPPCRPRR